MKSDLVGHFLPTAKNLLTGSERMELKLPDGDRLIGRRVPAIDESRRAGTVRGLALETYHSGKSDDLARAVRWGRKNRGRRQVMIGYSLSGNATCLLAARVVPRLGAESPSEAELESRIEGATPDLCIAVNPPFDLEKNAVRLSYSPSVIYGQRFMFDLIECLGDRVALDADNDERKRLRDLAKSARAGVRPWQNVIHFDRAYTGKAAGFQDHSAYYARASGGQFLGKVAVPLILLMGYVDHETFSGSFRGQTRWLENRLHGYLRVAASQP